MTVVLSDHRSLQILHFLIPAYGKAELDFNASLLVVTPKEISSLNAMIRGAVPPAQKAAYDKLANSPKAGGLAFLGLWANGRDPGASMTHFGISAVDQSKIIAKVADVSNTRNTFNYKTEVDNSQGGKSTTGQLSVVTVNVDVPHPKTGAITTRTIIAPNVTASAKRVASGATPKIQANPLYHVE